MGRGFSRGDRGRHPGTLYYNFELFSERNLLAHEDLREFIRTLEAAGELKRIRTEVDPILEISEIADRVSKRGGPALLFENVKGSRMPLLINAFGSDRR